MLKIQVKCSAIRWVEGGGGSWSILLWKEMSNWLIWKIHLMYSIVTFLWQWEKLESIHLSNVLNVPDWLGVYSKQVNGKHNYIFLVPDIAHMNSNKQELIFIHIGIFFFLLAIVSKWIINIGTLFFNIQIL